MQTNIEKSIIETVEFLFVFDSNNLINLCKSFNVDTLNINVIPNNIFVWIFCSWSWPINR